MLFGIEELSSLDRPAVLKQRVEGAEIGVVDERAQRLGIPVRQDVPDRLGEAPERARVRRSVDVGVEEYGIGIGASRPDVVAVGRAIRQIPADGPGTRAGRVEANGQVGLDVVAVLGIVGVSLDPSPDRRVPAEDRHADRDERDVLADRR